MPLHQFTYFFLDKTGKFYYVDKNGKVRLSATPVMLPDAPEGWDEVKLSWGKSATYLGLTRTFSVPLKFVFDGAVILRYLRYNFGIDAYCRIVIHKLNKSFGAGMLHEDYFPGEVDFSKWEDADEGVTTEIKDAGPASLVKANEGTAFNIPYKDDARAITVKLDGIYLHETRNWIVPEDFTAADHIIGTQFVTQEGSAFGFASFSTFTDNNSGGAIDFTQNPGYFFALFQDIQGVRIKGEIRFTKADPFAGGGSIYLKTDTGLSILLGSYSAGAGLKVIPIDTTFDALNGQKYFLFNDVPGASGITYQETTLSISFQSRFKITFAPKRFTLKMFSQH
jgi:hypothetical protein